MPTTPNRGYPFPTLADANDPPRWIQLLAEALDADVNRVMNASPVAPVYQPGWGDYNPDNPVFLGLQATRSAAGLVGLSGMFARIGSSLNTAATQVVAILPEGYRPARRILLWMEGYTGSGYAPVRIDITADGQILAAWRTTNTWTGGTGGAASYVSLAGLSFVAAS
ncbi:hypothetical protein DBB34_09130 [Sphaerisporangium cinnabarinum]|nr:hypothetical protein [Sphaerisporangium cinnabarinum]PTU56414.1 hypothetical protein DBB34_09130 [Sphaerisporangium cinnabarinum]